MKNRDEFACANVRPTDSMTFIEYGGSPASYKLKKV